MQQLFFPFQAPMDKMRLVFPPLPAASLALLLYSVYCLFMPYTMALAVFAGSISGYIVYDMIHYYLHHGTPYGSYFRALKRYHVKHHYLDQQKGEWSLLCKEKCFLLAIITIWTKKKVSASGLPCVKKKFWWTYINWVFLSAFQSEQCCLYLNIILFWNLNWMLLM